MYWSILSLKCQHHQGVYIQYSLTVSANFSSITINLWLRPLRLQECFDWWSIIDNWLFVDFETSNITWINKFLYLKFQITNWKWCCYSPFATQRPARLDIIKHLIDLHGQDGRGRFLIPGSMCDVAGRVVPFIVVWVRG